MEDGVEEQVRDVVFKHLQDSTNGKQFCKNVVMHMTEQHSKYWQMTLGLWTPMYAYFTFGKMVKYKVEDLDITVQSFDWLLI